MEEYCRAGLATDHTQYITANALFMQENKSNNSYTKAHQ